MVLGHQVTEPVAPLANAPPGLRCHAPPCDAAFLVGTSETPEEAVRLPTNAPLPLCPPPQCPPPCLGYRRDFDSAFV